MRFWPYQRHTISSKGHNNSQICVFLASMHLISVINRLIYILKGRLAKNDQISYRTVCRVFLFQVTSLIPYKRYEFRVAATNGVGQSPWSQNSEQITAQVEAVKPRFNLSLLGKDIIAHVGSPAKVSQQNNIRTIY